jgi:SlyX protein
MSLEERVTDLETQLAFQDDTIQALSDVLATQRQEEMAGQFGVFEEEAPPPHY